MSRFDQLFRIRPHGQRGVVVLYLPWLLFLLAVSGTCTGQPDAPNAPEIAEIAADANVTETLIEQERKILKESEGFSEEQQKQALAQLDEARAWLQEADKLHTERDGLQATIAAGPGQLELRREGQAEPQTPLAPALDNLDDQDLEKLEAEYAEQQTRRQQALEELTQREREQTVYATLAKSGGGEIAEQQKALDDTRRLLGESDSSGGKLALRRVQRIWLGAREQMLKERLAFLNLRQNNLGLLSDLAQTRREALAAQADALQETLERLREAIHGRRAKAAQAAKDASLDAQASVPPEFRELQTKITAILDEQASVINRGAVVSSRLSSVRTSLTEVRADQEWVRHIIVVAEPGQMVSRLLQKRRIGLTTASGLRKEARDIHRQLDEAVLRRLVLDDEIRGQVGVSKQEQGLANQYPKALSSEPMAALREVLEPIQQSYRDAQADLQKAYTRYIGTLSELDAAHQQLVQALRAYTAFLDDQLLWMPSTGLIPLTHPEIIVAGLGWLVTPEHLRQLGIDLRKVWAERPGLVLLWLTATALLVGLRKRAVTGLKRSAEATRSVRTDSYQATWSALVYTVVLAGPGVVSFFGAAWLLQVPNTTAEFSFAISQGLAAVGTVLLLIGGMRQLCRPYGLAVRHLRWSETLCKSLRTHFTWFLPLALPFSFLTATGSIPGAEEGPLAQGRFAFLVLMGTSTILIYRIWRSNGPVLREMHDKTKAGLWVSFHFLWFPLALGVPIGLFLATLGGYYYTALLLVQRLNLTLWFWVGTRVVRDLLLRGVNVSQRRLRFLEALRRRQALREQRAAQQQQEPATVQDLPLEQEVPDYVELSSQVTTLLRVGHVIAMAIGLWLIWGAVLPALNFLDDIQLPLTTSQVVDGVSTEMPLTLGEVVLGLLLGGLTLLIAKNAPGVLEFSLLQRLPLTRAGRYAISSLTQYVIAALGIVITFGALGMQWSNIQWLVAALSVGLGFGLQEIVANFVSGIILLFERPIRVGDVVTVNNVSGTVSRIRIRATTIVNWERQELVIPNKAFITGELINWTLSDTINRLVITIGVAYGSDVPKALALMKETAETHPKVLSDPAPRVTFEGFGDNALTLLLRAYLDDMDARLPTTTDLHQAINDKFNAAGIVIAFPQRDVHLDISTPLQVVMREDRPAAPPTS